MNLSVRLLFAGLAATGALVLAGVAAAGSHPLLIVSNLDSYIQNQELIVAVDKISTSLRKDDVLIVCTDGLYNVLEDQELEAITRNDPPCIGMRSACTR